MVVETNESPMQNNLDLVQDGFLELVQISGIIGISAGHNNRINGCSDFNFFVIIVVLKTYICMYLVSQTSEFLLVSMEFNMNSASFKYNHLHSRYSLYCNWIRETKK